MTPEAIRRSTQRDQEASQTCLNPVFAVRISAQSFTRKILRQEDGWTKKVHGIGIDQSTAVLIGADGKATVSGQGAAYFFTLDHRPEICKPGKPLTVRGIAAYKLPGGDASKFDLKSWTGSGGSSFVVNVIDGKMARSDR